MSTVCAEVIASSLRALKLPGMRREYEALAQQGRAEAWSHEEYLRALLELEIRERQAHAVAQRIQQARFPALKAIEHLDWAALQGVTRAQVMALANCDFVAQKRDVIVAGPVGTGKTHIGLGLGLKAAEARYRVLFTRAADLVRDLTEARDERALGRLHSQLMRLDLLILDELGFVPFGRSGGELLFNLLSDRHGSASTLVTTNLAFGEWVQVFGNEKLTTALLDRLCYQADILVTRGPSFRTRGRLQPDESRAPTDEARD
jgi:DNA replication protein DnaC